MSRVRTRPEGPRAGAGGRAGSCDRAGRVIVSVTARLRNGQDLLGVATFNLTAGGTVTRRVTSVAGGLPWPGGPAVVRNLTAEEQRMFCGRGHRRRGRVYLADLAAWYGWTV